ncbi:Protein slit like protein [Argiope bruennichi]|uniref:Protein slit like protein n=1 Tax=Argiope bruennichi TaxID=94029 RepID=A0A8T0EM11_ARGBR|nr:Protein slit like protein [Argiope bruennichi]
MKSFLFVLLFAFTSCVVRALEDKCPSTDIKPCTCKTYFDGACIITCSLASQASVEKIADIPNLCDGHVHFVLVHTKIDGIPAKLWKVLLSSKTVDVSIKHAGIKGLVPPGTESIPDVYTSGEAVIKIDHSTVEQWDWKQFANFYSEKELTLVIDDTPLSGIGEDFKSIAKGQVHKVTIDSTGLTAIADQQFASFPDISSLSLQNNKLTSVSRSILPKPAKSLQFLHLNGNELTSLPGDLFTEMPALEVVYLRDNKLVELPQELFQSAPASLQRVDLVHNPWNCNCQLMWILKKSKTFANLGNCATPDELKNKKVSKVLQQLDC